MNQFCENHMISSVPAVIVNDEGLSRPKCPISPIDQTANIVVTDCSVVANNESCLQNSTNNLSIFSPYLNKARPTDTLQQSHMYVASQTTTHSLYDSALQENVNGSALFSTSSPYYQPLKQQPHPLQKTSNNLGKNIFLKNLNETHLKPIQFQSTPNKASNSLQMPAQTSKVNFHSILDLARSDDQKLSASINESVNTASSSSMACSSNSSGYASASISASSSSSSLSSLTGNNTSIINFHQHLNFLSMTSNNNKENATSEFLSKNKRKPRTQINRQQREILEYAYNLKGYPDSNEVEYLCNILGFEENVIRIWFQNKRARDKQRH